MEGSGKQSGSSFTGELLGAKDSSPASSSVSSSIFTTPSPASSSVSSSIFTTPPKVHGWNSLLSSETEKKNDSGSQSWSALSGVSGKNSIGSEGQSQGTRSKDVGSYFPEEKVKPFHYSSSIYYGGQDFYSRPKSAQNPDNAKFIKDREEDDGKADRGNWWQGSLYY